MSETATVEVLTAEVRVLMVGSRQVTLSVARQLDEVSAEEITPFGRIRTGARAAFAADETIEVIGSAGGNLARASMVRERYLCAGSMGSSWRRQIWVGKQVIVNRCHEHEVGKENPPPRDHVWFGWLGEDEIADEWHDLPLIVLAGLR